MKTRWISLWLVAFLLPGAGVEAGTWQAPVMATWTEDPRTTVTLAWERHQEGSASVAYGEEGGVLGAEEKQAERTRRHVFTLRGLKPGAHYRYKASSSDGYEAEGRFWTAPTDKSQPFTFVLHNDLQGGLQTGPASAVAAAIVAAAPDFVLSTGDLGESRYVADQAGAIQNWNLFFQCLEKELASFVFQATPGNHDEPENPDSFWYRLFEWPGNERDYSFGVGPVRFILADATEFEVAGRTAWLARELQAAAFDPEVTWVVPAFHRPPFSWGDREGDGDIQKWWVPLFTRYEADLVLNGHAHTYQRTRPIEGVPYLVSGGGGAWLYPVEPGHPEIAFGTSTFHFVQFRVEGPRLQIEGKLPDGTVFDRADLVARRHVRVEPVFPARGKACTIEYDAENGPLAESGRVSLRLGRDEFSEVLADLPMEREAATGRWKATFPVPESVKGHLMFCFFDPETDIWHNNHARNWQALVARDW